MRLGEEHFRVITGAFDGGRDEYWFRQHLPDDGSVTFIDNTSALCTIGVWGPNARGAGRRHPCTDAPTTSRNDGVPVRHGAARC